MKSKADLLALLVKVKNNGMHNHSKWDFMDSMQSPLALQHRKKKEAEGNEKYSNKCCVALQAVEPKQPCEVGNTEKRFCL